MQIKIDHLLINLDSGAVSAHGHAREPVKATSLAVLNLLIAAQGQTVGRQDIIDEVWQGNYGVGDKGLTHSIWELRKILESDGQVCIKTIPKQGYRFIAQWVPVENKTRAPIWQVGAGALTVTIGILALIWWNWPRTEDGIVLGEEQPLVSMVHATVRPVTHLTAGLMAFVVIREQEQQLLFRSLHTAEIVETGLAFRRIGAISFQNNTSNLVLAIVDEQGQCKLISYDYEHQTHRELTVCNDAYDYELAWDPSGRYLAFINLDDTGMGSIYLYDSQTDTRQLAIKPFSTTHYFMPRHVCWLGPDLLVYSLPVDIDFRGLYLRKNGRTARIGTAKFVLESLACDVQNQQIWVSGISGQNHGSWVLQTDGSVNRVDDRKFRDLHVGQSGNTLYYTRTSDNRKIAALTLNNLHQDVVFASSGEDYFPVVSSVGQSLAFVSKRRDRQGVYLLEDSQSSARIISKDFLLAKQPGWSVDGKDIVFIAHNFDNRYRVIQYRRDSGQLQTLVDDGFEYDSPIYVDSDKALLVISNRETGQWRSWRLDLETGNWHQFVDDSLEYHQFNQTTQAYYYVNAKGELYRFDQNRTELITDGLYKSDFYNWTPYRDGVVYVQRTAEHDVIRYCVDDCVDLHRFEPMFIDIEGKLAYSLSSDKLYFVTNSRMESDIVSIALK